MTIIDVIAKWPGSVNDARILRNSSLYEKFTEQVLPYLPNGIIIGDAGYPLLEWLVVPYVDHPGMTEGQRRFNKTHKSARCVIERIIGILKRRWACLKELRLRPEKCCKIVVVCCIVHNYCGHIPLNEDELNVSVDHERDDDDLYNETGEGCEKTR